MSKQSEAKASQDYIPKAHNCGDCANLQSNMLMPQWMIDSNKVVPGSYNLASEYLMEKNIRCGIGGFAVKKMGICQEHTTKDAS